MPEFSDFEMHPLRKELRKRVSRIIWRMAIFRYSSWALFSAQLAILDDLLALEDSLRESRDRASALRNEAGQLAQAEMQGRKSLPENIKQQVNEIRREASDYDFAVRLLRYGRWLYRYVADGIAWRAYGFQRETIRALGAKEPVVFLSKKEGIEREIMLFKGMRNLGREWLPVMHDLTNCLRTADFSLFRNGALYRLIEAKIRQSGDTSSNNHQNVKSGRETRQAKRLQQVSDFLQSGNLEILHPEFKGRAFSTPIVEKHNYKSISAAIKSARAHKFGFREHERGILYLAFDAHKRSEDTAFLRASEQHPHIFETLFTFRAITPRFQEYHVSLPITAMHLPIRDIIDILFGRIAVICILNYQCVEEFCQNNGVPLRFERIGGNEMKIMVESKPYPGEVRDGLWNRLLLEGLSLQSFSDLLKAIMIEASTLGSEPSNLAPARNDVAGKN